jgi:adenine/guanine/hypoxanthine permease
MEKTKTWKEIIAGLTTFFTMTYMVVVIPSILSTPGTGIPFAGALTATICLTVLATLFMGIYADLPYAVAPGIGMVAFLVFSIILRAGVPYPQALGMVFWAGIVFILISVTPLRSLIAKAIPVSLRIAAATGIGIFLTFIGLKNAGLVVSDPATFVQPGPLGVTQLLSLLGIFITLFFMKRGQTFSFIIAILTITAIAWGTGLIEAPKSFFSTPDFTTMSFKLDIWNAVNMTTLPIIMAIFITQFFDTISTFIGLSHAADMLDENGQPKNLRKGLLVDAFSTLIASLLGTSPGTAYLESSAGIEVGGRRGVTAITTALCFVPCLFLAPLAAMVPAYATAPVLIIVGALMFKNVTKLPLDKLEDAIPAFLTTVLIPLTFSITQGILWGFIFHVILYVISKRAKEIHPIMYGVAAVSVIMLVTQNMI